MSAQSRIRVVCRKRPLSKKEASLKHQDVVSCQSGAVLIREPKLKVDLTRYVEEHLFQFDDSFGEDVSNEVLYQSCVRPLVSAMFSGGRCTCFAYGQTGAGKTWTMLGDGRTPGIFQLASTDIFNHLGELNRDSKSDSLRWSVGVSFYEIYCGKLYDLLNSRCLLHARENSQQRVVIVGLKEQVLTTVDEMIALLGTGLASRTTGVTGANVDSSRSHAILQVCLRQGGVDEPIGKLSFIDLAGSERGADTIEQDRQTRIDGAEINKSLLALKECIRALDQQLDHTPFRGSKLTQVLKDSFVGKSCQTVMIANLSPSSACVEHTLNTLRYAYRVKEMTSANDLSSGKLQRLRKVEEASVDGGDENDSLPAESKQFVPQSSQNNLLDSLAKQHDVLISKILTSEEALVTAHRRQVDLSVQLLQKEMLQLDAIDQPGSDVDSYVQFLDGILSAKSQALAELKARLDTFKSQLKDEEALSRKFHDISQSQSAAQKVSSIQHASRQTQPSRK